MIVGLCGLERSILSKADCLEGEESSLDIFLWLSSKSSNLFKVIIPLNVLFLFLFDRLFLFLLFQ